MVGSCGSHYHYPAYFVSPLFDYRGTQEKTASNFRDNKCRFNSFTILYFTAILLARKANPTKVKQSNYI
jgi:hypothetical protein